MSTLLRIPKPKPLALASAPDVLTVEEFAACARVGRNAAYELVATGRIAHAKIGRSIRIPKTAVIAFLEGREVAQTG